MNTGRSKALKSFVCKSKRARDTLALDQKEEKRTVLVVTRRRLSYSTKLTATFWKRV